MLELKNIRKTYIVGDIETIALNDISVAFREKEFVAILGTSGSGKTTCLNIIGGLDHYDSGELKIKGKKTSDFTSRDWDAYRNNSIGFIFQSYNLISHLSIVANVELGMTLSGVSKEEKHKKALEVLKEVGLGDHLHKKPNQLSGGQMQRVAIARALANDPEILLCDEPTGALDTNTSIQIMDLIKEVAKDRLVIMVTHNPELAEQYADRIIKFKDGMIISDSKPHKERDKEDEFKLKKTSMNFLTALSLSYRNIMTKKGRTFLTAFASSIGIIGIAVILSLSTGFKRQILKFQSDTLEEYPIIISQMAAEVNEEDMKMMEQEMKDKMMGTVEFTDADKIYPYDSSANTFIHQNKLNETYTNYLEAISTDICSSIGYTRIVNMNLIRDIKGKIQPVMLSAPASENEASMMSSSSGLSSYPTVLKEGEESYLEKNYDVLAGKYPKDATDIVLVVDEKNRVDYKNLEALGFEAKNLKSMEFSDIVGTEIKLVSNDLYYVKTERGNYVPGTDYEKMYNADDTLTLKISAIVRVKKDVRLGLLNVGIAYSDELAQLVIDRAAESDIVKAQKESDVNVITMEKVDEATKESLSAYLGGSSTPYMIMVYPDTFEDKDAVISYLDAYNEGKDKDDQVIYTDLASTMSEMTGGIMDGITVVLVAFAAISLLVSLVMISIITYTSVLERTKEIGILRALGARKKDITRVFDAETCILGVFSGLLGITVAYLLTFPINSILYKLTDLKNVAVLKPSYAITLVIVSTILTMLGGHIPAKMASKRDTVEALRSE